MARLTKYLTTLIRQYRMARNKSHGKGRSGFREAILMALTGASIAARIAKTPANPSWWMVRIAKEARP